MRTLVRTSKRRIRIAVPGFGPIQGSERGLTLVETLLALAILGVVAGVYLTGLTVSSKTVMISQERVSAESLAKNQMEDTKAQLYVPEAASYPAITVPSDLAAQGYSITVAVEPLHSPDDGIQEITVSISRDVDILFTLVGYKRLPDEET